MLAVFQDVRQHKRLLIFHQMQVGGGGLGRQTCGHKVLSLSSGSKLKCHVDLIINKKTARASVLHPPSSSCGVIRRDVFFMSWLMGGERTGGWRYFSLPYVVL